MGMTTVRVEEGRPADPEQWESVDFLVDPGPFHSVVPAATLAKLGIGPVEKRSFRSPDGCRVNRQAGIAAFRLGERIGGADVIFGEEGDSNLLGSFTLEALRLGLDPLKRELNELPMAL
jgi:hypothetical protein